VKRINTLVQFASAVSLLFKRNISQLVSWNQKNFFLIFLSQLLLVVLLPLHCYAV